MVAKIELGDIAVDVVQKEIHRTGISVYLDIGRVRISAPLRINIDTIRIFTISKLGWIKQQLKKLQAQERERRASIFARESHYI